MTTPKPLLSNEALEAMCSKWLPRLEHEFALALKIRDIYEKDRKEKDELIQTLVNMADRMAHFEALYRSGLSQQTVFENWQEIAAEWHDLRPLAEAQGYKPTE